MNLELEKLSLIDISSEDDFLIDSQLRRDSFTGFRLSVAFEDGYESKLFPFGTNRSKVVNSADVFEQVPKEGIQDDYKSNARKSLAWDSAFFTSAGVLNAEELSMVNKGFRKTSEMNVLPGINKELQGVAESNCASGSEELHSFDINLFKDEKQKSSTSEVTPRIMRNAPSRESNSPHLLKPSSRLSGLSKSFPPATPSKRSALGNTRTASKKPCVAGSFNSVTPGSTKSYVSSPSTVSSVNVSSPTYDRNENASSESTDKSLWNSFRRNKTRLDSLSNSTCKNSLPRLSYCLSPASSTDNWSANKGGLIDLHATGVSDLENTPTSSTSGDVTSHSRASGLRLPSPKFGYFDMVQQEPSHKQGTETSPPSEISIGLMHGKFQAMRCIKSISQSRKLKQTSSTVAIKSMSNQSKAQPSSSPREQFKKPKGVVPSNNRHVSGKTNSRLVNTSRSRSNQDKKVHEKGNRQRHEMNHYSSYVVFGKENTFINKDQVDGLCKRFRSVDLSNDVGTGL